MINRVYSLKPVQCLHEYLMERHRTNSPEKKYILTCEYKHFTELSKIFPERSGGGYIATTFGTTYEMDKNMRKGGMCEVYYDRGAFKRLATDGVLIVNRVPDFLKDGYTDGYAYPASIFNIIHSENNGELVELHIKDAK